MFFRFVTATVFVSSSPELDRWSAYDPDEIIQRNANQSSIDLAKCANEIRVYSFLFVALLVFAIVRITVCTVFQFKFWFVIFALKFLSFSCFAIILAQQKFWENNCP